MKQLIFLFAIAFGFTFTSCKKETPQPQPQPQIQTPTTQYDKLVVMSTEYMDSVVVTNVSKDTTEHLLPTFSVLQCGLDYNLSLFSLSSSASEGDTISVTIYHSAYTFGALLITLFVANDNTVLCDNIGGNNYQTSSGGSSTFTFTAD